MSIKTTIVNNTITFASSTGEELTIIVDGLSPDILSVATLHGLKQKIGDAGAIACNTITGKPATDAEKMAAMREVYERLTAGQWNKIREAGESDSGILFRALCAVYSSKSSDAIRAYLETKSKEEKAALRKVPAIAAKMDELRAASAKAAGIDTNALLAGLED